MAFGTDPTPDGLANPPIDDLMKHADLAMYQAKEAGRNTVRFFDPEMHAAVVQRLALEQSASLNEAYQTLKSPSKRARYLLAMNGGELPMEVTVHDPDFLMQQMQWREELEDLQDDADVAGVAVFKRRLKTAQDELNESFAACWDDAAQREQAERLMRRMQFLDKLTYEVRQLEERLDD